MSERTEEALTASISKKQFARGFSDGEVGHSPSLLGGSYWNGYVQGSAKSDNFAHRSWVGGMEAGRERRGLKDEVEALKDERARILTRVRAILQWVPKDDPSREWLEALEQ